MILQSAVEFLTDPEKMLVVVVSLLLGISALLAWKKLNRPALLYAHLFFVLTPFFYFALSINCSLSLVHGLLSWCTALATKFFIYIVPPLMAVSFIGGWLVLPWLYRRFAGQLSMKLFNDLCRSTGISAELFLLDKAKPVAFSSGESVFVSVGLFESLSKKELEAVLLHELYHVKSRSSWNKFSAGFVRIFSPIAWFSSCAVEAEELAADAFATKMQGTCKYLNSAKGKV
jgi:Zn-dependent protease with chaperone function